MKQIRPANKNTAQCKPSSGLNIATIPNDNNIIPTSNKITADKTVFQFSCILGCCHQYPFPTWLVGYAYSGINESLSLDVASSATCLKPLQY